MRCPGLVVVVGDIATSLEPSHFIATASECENSDSDEREQDIIVWSNLSCRLKGNPSADR